MLPIVVPVPAFRRPDGGLDPGAIERYAERLCATWVQTVIIAGPASMGEDCTPQERAEQARIWQENRGELDLVFACWNRDDFRLAERQGLRPLAMLSAADEDELARLISQLPDEAIAYANPRYSRSLLSTDLVKKVAAAGRLPSGIKLSKVTTDQIEQIRAALGDEVEVWHGSSRNIAASLGAGATAVVAAPLAARPAHLPAPTIVAIQAAVDDIQRQMDQQPGHVERVQTVATLALQSIAEDQQTGDQSR